MRDYRYLQTDEVRLKRNNSMRGKPLSAQHKENISNSRKRFLDENPHMVPYVLNHSSKKSWPEKTFEKILIDNNITGWQYNYPVKRYRLDFAFPEIKVDIEIDGATHSLVEKTKKIDAERNAFLLQAGWRILRIDAKMLYGENKNTVLNQIVEFINDSRVFGILQAPQKIRRPKQDISTSLKEYHRVKNQSKVKIILETDEDFSKKGWTGRIAKMLELEPQSVRRWLKIHMPEFYETVVLRQGTAPCSSG